MNQTQATQMLNMFSAELSKRKHILPPVSASVKCGTRVLYGKKADKIIYAQTFWKLIQVPIDRPISHK